MVNKFQAVLPRHGKKMTPEGVQVGIKIGWVQMNGWDPHAEHVLLPVRPHRPKVQAAEVLILEGDSAEVRTPEEAARVREGLRRRDAQIPAARQVDPREPAGVSGESVKQIDVKALQRKGKLVSNCRPGFFRGRIDACHGDTIWK